MLKIYIARHGQDEDNAQGILNGRRDRPLTFVGRQQAELLGEKIRKAGITFNSVYTSPLLRTRQTADMIASETHSPAPQTLDSLIERDFGAMTGLPVASITERCTPDIIPTDTVVYFLSPDGAETFPDLLERAKKILGDITARHTDGAILLVTHGDIGKMIYAAYYTVPWRETLTQFHFGNSELLLLSPDSPAVETHAFMIKQHNT